MHDDLELLVLLEPALHLACCECQHGQPRAGSQPLLRPAVDCWRRVNFPLPSTCIELITIRGSTLRIKGVCVLRVRPDRPMCDAAALLPLPLAPRSTMGVNCVNASAALSAHSRLHTRSQREVKTQHEHAPRTWEAREQAPGSREGSGGGCTGLRLAAVGGRGRRLGVAEVAAEGLHDGLRVAGDVPAERERGGEGKRESVRSSSDRLQRAICDSGGTAAGIGGHSEQEAWPVVAGRREGEARGEGARTHAVSRSVWKKRMASFRRSRSEYLQARQAWPRPSCAGPGAEGARSGARLRAATPARQVARTGQGWGASETRRDRDGGWGRDSARTFGWAGRCGRASASGPRRWTRRASARPCSRACAPRCTP